MAADDRDDMFHDASGAGRSGDPDRWPANEEGPAGQIDAPKTGKSSVVKVLLILLAVFVVAAVLCCGLGYFFVFRNLNLKTYKTPAEVEQLTQEIVPIEIPAGYSPVMGMKMNLFGTGVEMAMYDTPGKGLLQLVGLSGQAVNDPNTQQQLDAQMRAQGGGSPHRIDVSGTEKKTVTVNGQETEFTVETGTESQSKAEWKRVSGTVTANGKLVRLLLEMPTADYDEGQVTQMLESIGKK
jgi:hypothetical protein